MDLVLVAIRTTSAPMVITLEVGAARYSRTKIVPVVAVAVTESMEVASVKFS